MTYKEFSDAVLADVYGGVPSDSADLTPRQIIVMANRAFAALAKKSMYENSNLEGVSYANDEFICTFEVTLNAADSSGFRYFNMPTAPVGLPKSRGVTFVGGAQAMRNGFKKIPANNLSVYLNKEIPQTVIYWTEGSKGYVKALDGSTLPTLLKVKTIGRDSASLSDEISAPLDAINEAHNMVVAMARAQTGRDTTNDNLDINDVK
jgi:hypothetical protein